MSRRSIARSCSATPSMRSYPCTRAARSGCASISTAWRAASRAFAWTPPLTHAEWDGILQALIERNGGGDQYVYLPGDARRGVRPKSRLAGRDSSRRCSPSATALEPASPALLEHGVAAITARRTSAGPGATSSPPRCSRMCCSRISRSMPAHSKPSCSSAASSPKGSSTTVHVIMRRCEFTRRPTAITFCPARRARWCGARGALRHSERRARRVTEAQLRARGRNLARLLHPRRAAGDPARRQAGGHGQGRPVVRAHACRLPRLHARARRDSPPL